MKLSRLAVILSAITVSALVISCPPSPPPPVYHGTLIITEVGSCPYTNVSSWLEVYNATTEIAQLSDFKLRTYARGWSDPWSFYGIVTFNLPSLLIQPGSYALIRGRIYSDYVNGARIVYIDDGAGHVPNWVFDGTSAGSGFLELLKDGATVDFVRFGSNAENPTTAGGWTGGDAPALPYSDSAHYGKSIARDGSNNDTNAPADWSSRDVATAAGPNDVAVTAPADTDSDGIPDVNEQSGTTFAGLPLYDWGARSGQKDIFIHIDYMNSTDPGVIPRKEALDKVVAAFALKSITLHFDVGDLYGSGIADYNLDNTSHRVPLATTVTIGATGTANIYYYKFNYMNLAKKQIFHYLLFGYSQNLDGSGGSSGIAEYPGNDFIVTLGNWGLATTPTSALNKLVNYQASTIMHEFGHNLGLGHGGNSGINYKPNYYSIMNYMYQLYGLSQIGNQEGDRYWAYRKWNVNDPAFASYSFTMTRDNTSTNFAMDYSDGGGGAIDENSVIESQGLRRSGSTAVDFNGDNDAVDTISMNLNSTYDATLDSLTDWNDWGNINLFFQRTWGGYETGAASPDGLLIMPDRVGDDRQPYIVETLTPAHIH